MLFWYWLNELCVRGVSLYSLIVVGYVHIGVESSGFNPLLKKKRRGNIKKERYRRGNYRRDHSYCLSASRRVESCVSCALLLGAWHFIEHLECRHPPTPFGCGPWWHHRNSDEHTTLRSTVSLEGGVDTAGEARRPPDTQLSRQRRRQNGKTAMDESNQKREARGVLSSWLSSASMAPLQEGRPKSVLSGKGMSVLLVGLWPISSFSWAYIANPTDRSIGRRCSLKFAGLRAISFFFLKTR